MSKPLKKITRKTEIDSINLQTGEVLANIISTEYYVPNEPDFIKLYLTDICALNGIPKAHGDILHCLLLRMDWDNRIYLSNDIRKLVCEVLNITMPTLKSAIKHFVDTEILYRVTRGKFLANPYIVGKGKWKDIQDIRMSINYQSGQRTIESVIKNTP